MNIVDQSDPRFQTYRNEIESESRYGRVHRIKYYHANLALEDLKARTELGIEPTDDEISHLEYRFDLAAQDSEGIDELMSLRASLIRAWIRPIVWAGIINLQGLSKAEARNVAQKIDIVKAGDDTADLVHMALYIHDRIGDIHESERDDEVERKRREINGFLHEAALSQLGVRHNSFKRFILPSLAYDDALNPMQNQRIDGFLLDNRRNADNQSGRRPTTIYPFQVGRSGEHLHVSREIPMIDGVLTGNVKSSHHWPNDNRDFGTSRRLVTERRAKRLSGVAIRTLDRIGSNVFNYITTVPS